MVEPLPSIAADTAAATDSTPAGAFVRALGELGHGVLLLEGERVVDASDAFCDLVGHDRRTLLSLPSALDLVPRPQRERLRSVLRRYMAGKSVGRRFSVTIDTAQGKPAQLDVAIKSVGSVRGLPRLLVVANEAGDTNVYDDQLAFQKRMLEAIAETSLDAILVVALDGRMIYFNRRFVETWGIPDDVVTSRRDDEALAAVQAKLADPDSFIQRVSYLYDHPLEESHDELRLLDGRMFERYSAPVIGAEGTPRGRVWFFRDVSEERRTQAATDLLARSGELFGSSLDFEQTISQLAELVVPEMADWAAVDIVDQRNDFRRVGVAHVVPHGTDLLRQLHDEYPLRANEGRLRGRVVATLEPIALYELNDRQLRRLSRDERHYRMLKELGVRSALWIPLTVRERVVGVLSAGFGPGSRLYGPGDLNLLRELARRAALALDNALLYRAVGRAERRQAAVAAVGQNALLGMEYTALAQSAAEMLAPIMDVPFIEVLQLQPDGRRLKLVAGVGWSKGLVGEAHVRAGLGSQGGYTLATAGPVVLDDLATETRFRPPALLKRHGIVSGVTVVIGSIAEPHGVLGAHTTTHRVFAEDDINLLQAVANVLGAAIERQRTEDRLNLMAASEQSRAAQLRAVIQSIGDAVVVCDSQGSVVIANPAAESLLGARPGEGMAGILRRFEWPTDRQPGDLGPGEGMELLLATGAAPGTATGAAGKASAGDRWMELSIYPVLSDGQATPAAGGTILVMRDVTAARNARAVREAFLGMLSHELRTPVTTIYGGSERLSRRAELVGQEERREVLEDIRAESDRLYRLVENLLVLSRVERQGLQIETEPVLLQRLIPRVVEAESARWPGARFVIELPAGLPPVAAEETYVEQVLRNLLGNAAKYGGDEPVTVTATDLGSSVSVTVADRGAGFAADEGERLFDLFYRSPSVTRVASGAGIGLFVSRHLIAAMDGRMWARNRDGGGAEFGFEAPVFQAE